MVAQQIASSLFCPAAQVSDWFFLLRLCEQTIGQVALPPFLTDVSSLLLHVPASRGHRP